MKRLVLALMLLALPAWGADLAAGATAYLLGDYATALRELRPLAERGDAVGQFGLGLMYANGQGVPQDYAEAMKWFRRAAEQGLADGQFNLAIMYHKGQGVAQNYAEAVKWYRRAADQGDAGAQSMLGFMYGEGRGVPRNLVRAHLWLNLSVANEQDMKSRGLSVEARDLVASRMTPAQIAEAQRLAREWKPVAPTPAPALREERPATAERRPPRQEPTPRTQIRQYSTGSGFVVSAAGHVLTNQHVIEGCVEVRGPQGTLRTSAADKANDLALLVGGGRPAAEAPPVASFRAGRGIRLGDPVMVAGFPLRGLLASDVNVTTGTVSALAGPGDDRSLIQITAPVQQGNSGGPVLDSAGNVVGVVLAKLDAVRLARLTGDLAQNVNFAVAAGTVRAFLDAQGVGYETSGAEAAIEPADIAGRARRFTIAIECWK